jgi:serine/threonine protein kinase
MNHGLPVSQRPRTLLADRFRLRSPLAHGGMGELWIAEHLGLGTEVVVKFISAHLSDRPGAAERFAREAAAAARVNSPHVVKILDYGTSPEGAPFIVMEKLEGRDLASYLAERGALPPDSVARIVRQLAKALTKAHAARIVHRDIKPANVFLCATEGELFVKLLDFGVAKTLATDGPAATMSGMCVGTPGYMSPEQILASKSLDYRADLWSLGVLAFHGLTGRKPFDGETAGAVLLAIHTLALPRPSKYLPSLPAEVDGWFVRACAREPEERFQSATAMANALSSALALSVDPLTPEPEEAPLAEAAPTLSAPAPLAAARDDSLLQSSTTEHGPRMETRRSRVAVLIAAAAVVAVGGAAYAGSKRMGGAPAPSAQATPPSEAEVTPLAENVQVSPRSRGDMTHLPQDELQPVPAAPPRLPETETAQVAAARPDVSPRPTLAKPKAHAQATAASATAERAATPTPTSGAIAAATPASSSSSSSPTASASAEAETPSRLFVMPDARR